jgi:hypothetical protein
VTVVQRTPARHALRRRGQEARRAARADGSTTPPPASCVSDAEIRLLGVGGYAGPAPPQDATVMLSGDPPSDCRSVAVCDAGHDLRSHPHRSRDHAICNSLDLRRGVADASGHAAVLGQRAHGRQNTPNALSPNTTKLSNQAPAPPPPPLRALPPPPAPPLDLLPMPKASSASVVRTSPGKRRSTACGPLRNQYGVCGRSLPPGTARSPDRRARQRSPTTARLPNGWAGAARLCKAPRVFADRLSVVHATSKAI